MSDCKESKELKPVSNVSNVSIESNEELWDQIGFHKPIAGFYYNISLALVGMVLSIVLFGYLVGFFYPFPESLGYKDIAFGYFSLLFTIFDTGTGAVMGRFIPEANIKNPERMIHYIQFFIWYQMLTGLIQTTLVSVYALFFASQSTLAYTVWIMLICSTTQWPGFLWAFKNVIDALQYYDKSRILNFMLGTVFQNITNYLFLYLGRIYGEAHPEMGPILGIAIGAAVGSYIDDFFAMWLSAYFFDKILKNYGISSKRCFKIEFTWEEIKPVVIYSLKTGIPGYITSSVSYIAFLITIQYIPQYTTFNFLAIIGGSIPDSLGWFGGVGGSALISESYMNGKPVLTQYYIGQEVRFNFFTLGFWVPIMLIVVKVMPFAWGALNMAQYAIAINFIIPTLIRFSIERFKDTPGNVMYGANKPNFGIFLSIFSCFCDLGLKYLYLVVLKLPYKLGFVGTIWLITVGYVPLTIFIEILGYAYIHKKIVKIKIPWKQLTIGMVIPSIISYIFGIIVFYSILEPLGIRYGFLLGLLPVGVVTIFLILLLYFVMSGFFGGWDTINLDEFRKASQMSGPSRFLISPVYKLVEKACIKSKYHNRFSLPTEEVVQSAKELLEIKRINREKLKNKEIK